MKSSSNSDSPSSLYAKLSSRPLHWVVVSFTFSHQSNLFVCFSFINCCFMQGRSKKCIQTTWDFEVFPQTWMLGLFGPHFCDLCIKPHNRGRPYSHFTTRPFFFCQKQSTISFSISFLPLRPNDSFLFITLEQFNNLSLQNNTVQCIFMYIVLKVHFIKLC